jgi:TolB-like protein
VLPFQSLGGDARYDTLANALSHDVIVELSRMHWMFVIARGSSFRFRGPDTDLGAAARILGVRYLLTGSMAIHDSTSIVTAELSQGCDGQVLWADRFEGSLDDLLELRLTIASRIVSALEVRVAVAEANRAASLPTENLDAWSAYHRGLWHMYRFTRHDNEIAARMFERALDADARFARAHAGLSFTHFQNAFIGYSRDCDAERSSALARAERSLELDPLDPFANLTMGRARWIGGDLEGSLSWYERAVSLSPNYAFAIYNHALADALCGHGSESEAGVAQAMALSPVDPLHYAMLATRTLSHIVRGDYAEARDWADRAGNAPNAHIHIFVIAALANALAGDEPAARQWAARVRKAAARFDRSDFLRSFCFRDPATLAKVAATLKRLV